MIATEIHPPFYSFIPYPRKFPPPFVHLYVVSRARFNTVSSPCIFFHPGHSPRPSVSCLKNIKTKKYTTRLSCAPPPLRSQSTKRLLFKNKIIIIKKRFFFANQSICNDNRLIFFYKTNPCPKNELKNKKRVATRGLPRGSPILVLLSPKHV